MIKTKVFWIASTHQSPLVGAKDEKVLPEDALAKALRGFLFPWSLP